MIAGLHVRWVESFLQAGEKLVGVLRCVMPVRFIVIIPAGCPREAALLEEASAADDDVEGCLACRDISQHQKAEQQEIYVPPDSQCDPSASLVKGAF